MADPLDPNIVRALGEWKTETLVAVSIVAIIALLVVFGVRAFERWLDARMQSRRAQAERHRELAESKAKDERARRYTDTLQSLSNAVVRLDASSQDTNRAIEGLTVATRETSTTVRTLLGTMKGVINPTDSRRIIEDEIWGLGREVIRAFRASLRENHYRNREQRVEDKLTGALHKIFDRAQLKLASFDMAFDPSCYFPCDDSGQYEIVRRLWAKAVPLYKTPINYEVRHLAADRDAEVTDFVSAVLRQAIAEGAVAADLDYRTGGGTETGMTPTAATHATQSARTPLSRSYYRTPLPALEPIQTPTEFATQALRTDDDSGIMPPKA